MKPYVICHMLSSADGRIVAKNWGQFPGRDQYEITGNTLEGDAWFCGRITMQEGFASDAPPVLSPAPQPIGRTDFIAPYNTDSFAVAVDAHGKLGWDEAYIDNDHIITVLTEQVPDDYLAYLRAKGISYIFGGKTELDFVLVLGKLGSLFPIRRLLLEGGGNINGSLLNAGLIDELSFLHYPLVDGSWHTPTLFDVSPSLPANGIARLKLLGVQQLPHDILWLRYQVVKPGE